MDFWATLDELWGETLGDQRVRVAILDGVVDLSHPSLRGAHLTVITDAGSSAVAEPSGSQHGTQVASIIFGQPGTEVRGIAPHSHGLIIPIFEDCDPRQTPICSQADLGRAVDRAVSAGANIINISAGEVSHDGGVDPVLAAALRRCAESGVLVVAAVRLDQCGQIEIPAALPSVLAVGALTAQDVPVGCTATPQYANILFAPGEGIVGAIPGGGTVAGRGSSYAAPIVTGVAALLLSVQLKAGGALDVTVVRDALLDGALDDGNGGTADSPTVQRLNPRGAARALRHMVAVRSAGSIPDFRSQAIGSAIVSYDNAYAVTDKALEDKYGNVLPDKFGTIDIIIPGGHTYNVADLHYPLAADRWGMRLLPVSDDVHVTLPDGTSGRGYEAVDDCLRRAMNLRAAEPVYALLSYVRPDEHSADLYGLRGTQKMQMGHKHLAGYVGGGRTVHVLPSKTDWKGDGPLNMRWNVDRYPANVQVISLHGTSQSMLNRNAHIVSSILATALKAPQHAESLTCRSIDINTVLQYYRDSIRRADYLEDFSWFTNCAAHTTIVLNVLVNVPHNEPAFRETFGGDGSQLWLDFQRRYREIHGREFDSDDETYFEPLWKLAGLSADGIRPLTLHEYHAYQAAITEGRVDEHVGRRPLSAGQGLAWPLETVTDLMTTFMKVYVPFGNVGGFVAAGELLLLADLVQAKLATPSERYLQAISPVITALLVAEGLRNVRTDGRGLACATEALCRWLKGAQGDSSRDIDAAVRQTVERCANDADTRIVELALTRASDPVTWLEETLAREVATLRATAIGGAREVHANFFSSPSILHQIAVGLHPKSPFITVRTVCTVMDQEELNLRLSRGQATTGQGAAVGRPITDLALHNRKEHVRMKHVDMSLNTDARTEEPSSRPREASVVTPAAKAANGSCVDGCLDDSGQLIYALGRIGYDLVSQSRRDSIKQKMAEAADPDDPKELLQYLSDQPYDASAIRWTLNLDGTPIYVIEPRGPFARDAYALLQQFLRDQLEEGVERVAIPGQIAGQARLRSGAMVPVVVPEIRGMYSWTTKALVEAVAGPVPQEKEKGPKSQRVAKHEAVSNFLERVYYEIRNFGRTPQERALNFAATNAFEVERVYEQAIREEMDLDSIDVERSPVCPGSSDCWDVKLMFFFPQRPVQTVRKVYRFTVDVADVVPASIGPMRGWFIR